MPPPTGWSGCAAGSWWATKRGRGRRFGDLERFALTLLAPHLEPLLLAARHAPPVPRLPVTDRQWQILERVRLGLANKQIARDLEVSPATVRKHLENIYRSLDVQSRGAAVHVAFGDADGTVAQQHRPLCGQHCRLDPFPVERRDHRHRVVVEFGR